MREIKGFPAAGRISIEMTGFKDLGLKNITDLIMDMGDMIEYKK
jgi:hypothetical protein